MVVFAANATADTQDIIDKWLESDELVKFKLQNKLRLHDNTVLIRLGIINLLKHLPDNDEIKEYRAALTKPDEFDYFMKEQLEEKVQ